MIDKIELWNDLLNIYCKFIRHDIFTSLKDGREFPFIKQTITVCHKILLDKDVKKPRTLLNILKNKQYNNTDYKKYDTENVFCNPIYPNDKKTYLLLSEEKKRYYRAIKKL